MVSANDSTAVEFTLSPGNSHDAPEGRILMETIGKQSPTINLLMDRAYEDDYTRYIAQTLGFCPVVPPKSNRIFPWEYDRNLYKQRNKVERLFRRLKAFRRIFSRFDKLDVIFIGFIYFALSVIAIRLV